jgi:hypothetical protein
MSKSLSITKNHFPVDKLTGWDIPIAQAQQRIQDLSFSIKVFEQKKAAGEPYLGSVGQLQSDSALIELATGTEAESVPA